MPFAEFAASHYEPDGIGDNAKWLVNAYAELNPSDPARQTRLSTTPGSLLHSTGLSTSCRGMWYQDGFSSSVIVADGTTLKLFPTDLGAATTMTGTLAGTDRVQACFAEAEGAFLANGSLYIAGSSSSFAAVTDGDYATLLSDHGVSAFTSIATLGQRLLFTYGSRFGYSAAADFDDVTTLSYYTAESSPDPLVAGAVLGDSYWLFGTQTIEPWVQTGSTDDPLSRIQVDPVTRGCKCRDSIVQLDNTLMWIADDGGLYRLDGVTPVRLDTRDAWVTRLIDETDPADIICSKSETDGHSFYFINMPTKCVVYDVSNGTFHVRKTYGSDTWQWAHQVRAGSDHFGGSRSGTRFAKLSRSHRFDNLTSASGTGDPIVHVHSAHLPSVSGRKPIQNVRLDGITGAGLATGQGSSPVVSLEISKDRGNTFGPSRSRSLGQAGDYKAAPFWSRCGRSRPGQTVLRFTVSDPVNYGAMTCAVNEGR